MILQSVMHLCSTPKLGKYHHKSVMTAPSDKMKSDKAFLNLWSCELCDLPPAMLHFYKSVPWHKANISVFGMITPRWQQVRAVTSRYIIVDQSTSCILWRSILEVTNSDLYMAASLCRKRYYHFTGKLIINDRAVLWDTILVIFV